VANADKQLRDDFANLEVLDFRRNYDECVGIMRKALEAS
jgi:hypothetical protein